MSDRLTLVVFKDHLSSRTLTVRLGWLRAFGLALLSVIALAVLAASLFLNAYRKTLASSSKMGTGRAEDLEKELSEVRASYESLKDQALNHPGSLAGAGSTFTFLPDESILEPLPARDSLPFRLEPMKAAWKGTTLQIRTGIEYAKDDGGNQQGHFVAVVRGPQSLRGYPEGVFAPAGSPALIKPGSGEFFSVSRFREIKADFGPYAHKDEARSVELSIFDSKNRLIWFERDEVETLGKNAPAAEAAPRATKATKAPKAPKAKPSVAPDESEPTESVPPAAESALRSSPAGGATE